MSKLRKLMALAAILFAASSALVSCSDDDAVNFGAIGINSLQATSSKVTLYWTIVSNGSCDGYQITICEGTRDNKGEVVIDETFDARTAYHTFEGLKENTAYVVTTKAIPNKDYGYSGADTYEMAFKTAPLVKDIVLDNITYPEGAAKGSATVSWTPLTDNAGSYNVIVYEWNDGYIVVANKAVSSIATGSITIDGIIRPGYDYIVAVIANPSNACWYKNGEYSYSDWVTAPEI